MKRVLKPINSAMTHTVNYDRIIPQHVARELIKDTFSNILDVSLSPEISDITLRTVIRAICKWKSNHGLSFHHNDFNTQHNTGKNVILIEADAHMYIHNKSVYLDLQRMFNLADTYSTAQGKLAEYHEIKVYRKLDEYFNFSRCSAQQIINCVDSTAFRNAIIDCYNKLKGCKKKDIKPLCDAAIEHMVGILDSQNIQVFTKDAVKKEVEAYRRREDLRPYREPATKKMIQKHRNDDPVYIDDATAYEVSSILDKMIKNSKDNKERSSLQLIKKFIHDNVLPADFDIVMHPEAHE